MIVVKNVQGGTATPSQFIIQVAGNNPSPSTFQGSSSGTTVSLGQGSYQVRETPIADYTPTYSSDCSGSISAGQTKTCTITNTYTAQQGTATLNVIKHLDNTNFGEQACDVTCFEFEVTGNNPTPSRFAASESGTPVTLGSGSYRVAEISTGQGYTVSYSPDCSGTINPDETKTCTVTNTAHFGKLTVIKQVVGSTASASTFRISYSHTCDPTIADCDGGGSFQGSESGEELLLIQGTYQVEENPPPPDYTPTYSGDCSGRIQAGEAKTCTVTNTYTGQ